MEQHTLPLVDRKEVARDTMAFLFNISGIGYNFEAGQHTDFTLQNPPHTDEEGNTRTFSFASSPNDKERLMIATRMRDSAFKNSLKEIPLGTKMKVKNPTGSFVLHEDTSRPAVFLIGGIGITPVRSIVSFATEQKLDHQIYLFYSDSTLSDMAFLDDLKSWQTQNPNFHFIPTLTKETPQGWKGESGRIDINMVKKHTKDLDRALFYTSGPDKMIVAMYKLLVDAGFSRDNIKTEEFVGY